VTTPEQLARINIDARLAAAGWLVQDRAQLNLGAGRGVAAREYPLRSGQADYLLFVDRKAVGVVEAKPEGMPLSGIEPQSQKYAQGLPDGLNTRRAFLPFLYESTGVETYFTNALDPAPRSRSLFAFHRPETLAAWDVEAQSLRARLQLLPPLITARLWAAQIEAITHLEASFAADKPRALIQMTMGSGKTFTAVNAVYRLIKHGGARRVLFLVDRSNLGRQALNEFQHFTLPDTGAKFGDVYNVQQLESNTIDAGAKVVITTIQRLYSMLRGEADFDTRNEETAAAYDQGPPREVAYNPSIPIEFFDFVIIDECHRSIYNLWRQVLEYFDAHLIGLTATPSKLTFGFFNGNLVMEYSRQRAVADGVNVDGQVYRIHTRITDTGSTVDTGFVVGKRDRRTRALRWELLDEELTYAATDLDRAVVAPDQIRTVLRTYKDRLFTDLFPGRSEVPKTLIFAKDDAHAEEIVRIAREEFGQGNDFCQKITYRVTGVTPEVLINTFRNSFYPRIAVTVDMIATGADIRPLEVLLFMRLVKSRLLYDQMVGRGTRTVSPTELQSVTPDALVKDRFILIDAVGVTDSELPEPPPTLDRNPILSFEAVLQRVAGGFTDEDTLSTLAARLLRLDQRLDDPTRAAISALAGGQSPADLAATLLHALDPDTQFEAARTLAGGSDPSDAQIAQAADQLLSHAAAAFDDPALRQSLLDAQRRSEITVDVVSQDALLEAGFTADGARATVESFRTWITEHQDEIDALQILFARPYAQRRLTYAAIKELTERLKLPPHAWTTEQLWRAFARLEHDKVRGVSARRALTDIISLVRHALDLDADLVPFPEVVRARYTRWLEDQQAAGHLFTPEQRWWLDHIAEQVGVNLHVQPDDFDYEPFFARGGRFGAIDALGDDWLALVEELNAALVPTAQA
jgi:type I restriction enzyme R subunit